MVTTTDGDLNGSLDLFRIKIWTEDLSGIEDVIYDNQLGLEVDQYGDKYLSGGNILVHKLK